MSDTEDEQTALAQKECKPCQGDAEPLKGEDLTPLAEQIDDDWKVVDEHHLARQFKFKNFVEALNFVNRVGDLAEQEQHHPDICLTWGRVDIEICTHKIDGLTESDFVLAAKIDELARGQ